MPGRMARRRRVARPNRRTAALRIGLAWLVVVALAVSRLRRADGILVASSGFAAVALTFLVLAWTDQGRWQAPIRELTRFARSARKGGVARVPAEFPTELAPL